MLPRPARLHRSSDFGATVRTGARAGRPLLVVHLAVVSAQDSSAHRSRPGESPRAGFVVSKAVGNSVVRHRVARRLRHLMASRLADLPAGAGVVVRALPASADASSDALAADLDSALRSALRKARERVDAVPAAVSL